MRYFSCFILLISVLGCSERGSLLDYPDAGPMMDNDAEICAVACGVEGDCCGEAEECISGECLPTCGDFNRCGENDDICCGAGELCVNDACVAPGNDCVDDLDCADGEYCDLGMERCLPQPIEGRECQYRPPENEFNPEVVWEWTEGATAVAPVVAPLQDKNGDGVVDEQDGGDVIVSAIFLEPETEWASIRNTTGRIIALDGESGRELWRSPEGIEVCYSATPAVADLDGDGIVEIVTVVASESSDPNPSRPSRCGGWFNAFLYPMSVAIFSGEDGSLEAVSSVDEVPLTGHHAPALAVGDVDLDGDGEIAIQGTLLDHEANAIWRIPGSYDSEDGYGWFVWPGSDMPVLTDVDDDAELEFVHPHGVWNHDGTERWTRTIESGEVMGTAIGRVVNNRPEYTGGQLIMVFSDRIDVIDAASGDLVDSFRVTRGGLLDSDDDGTPDVCDACYEFGADHDSDGNGTADCVECADHLARGQMQPAPPALADFDGDGVQEIGYAIGSIGFGDYIVVDVSSGEAVIEAEVALLDGSYASVASTVFDFDGNGSAEILMQDECHVRIRSGRDASTLWATSNTSVTVSEYPVVADVTRDGQANLIVGSNWIRESRCEGRDVPFTGSTNGVRVFRDRGNNWISARPVWNQHTYHIDNIESDGSLPSGVRPTWERHNTFRLNRYPNPETVFHAPDLIPTTIHTENGLCYGEADVSVRIVNEGYRTVPSGIRAVFYAETGEGETMVGEAYTVDALGPGDGVWLLFEVEPGDLPLDERGRATLRVQIDETHDDATGRGRFNECDEMNNAIEVELDCGII